MKTEFSPKWKSSVRPGKQRKYRAKAPLHIKHKFLSAHLSKELRAKYKRRGFPVRKGDKVKVMRGKFRRAIGDIERVDLKNERVFIKDVEIKKKDGRKIKIPIHPSKLMVITLNLDDKERVKALERNITKEKK